MKKCLLYWENKGSLSVLYWYCGQPVWKKALFFIKSRALFLGGTLTVRIEYPCAWFKFPWMLFDVVVVLARKCIRKSNTPLDGNQRRLFNAHDEVLMYCLDLINVNSSLYLSMCNFSVNLTIYICNSQYISN